MRRIAMVLMLAFLAGGAGAQSAGAPARDPGYEPLSGFVGQWTTQGRESRFRERCEWYHGGFHVVCHSESQRDDGSTGHSLSILGFVPGAGYVYSGIGSKGRYETFEKGRWSEGHFIFDTTRVAEGATVTDRITIGPFTEEGFEFVVTTSADGATWSEVARTRYLRLRQDGR